jgi:hypothetical protein
MPLRSRNWARIEGEHHTGALLTGGPLGSWDAAGASHARALVAAPRDLRMFYASPDAASGAWAIGAARSADGLTWKKTGARERECTLSAACFFAQRPTDS